MSAKVTDVMTRKVVAVHTSASFKEIAATLRERRVSAFPVVDDDGRVIGVVSEADLIAKEALEGGYESHPGPLSGLLHRRDLEKARGATAGELMSRPPVTVRPDDLVSHAAQLMHDRRVKRLPVVSADGKLVGIISRTDVLSVFSRPDARHPPRDQPDRAARAVPHRSRLVHGHGQGRHRDAGRERRKPPRSGTTSSARCGISKAWSPSATGSATPHSAGYVPVSGPLF